MKTQTLQDLSKGDLKLGVFFRLIFIRVMTVVILCLTLTFVVYLLWQGKFTLGSFLAGIVVGGICFWGRVRLRRFLSEQSKGKETTEIDCSKESVNASEVLPRTPVED